jgi:hypothetical protein
MKEEYNIYKDKNSNKMKEIEYLENKIDKLTKENENFKQDKINIEKKYVLLETDNNDLLNKARELEYWADELKSKLDAALEENIILHNEADAYKAETEETIQRLQEELEDYKNEITSKEKIISRLSMHRDFLLKTAYSGNDDINNEVIKLKSTQSLGRITPVIGKKIPEVFMKTYSNAFLGVKLDEKDIKKYDEDKLVKMSNDEETIDINKNNESDVNLSDKKEDEGDDKEFIREKIDAEIRNILDNRKNFILNTLAMENFSFDVGVSENKGKVRNIKIVDEMLSKIQMRKEKLLNQKKLMQVKLEKIGIKIC